MKKLSILLAIALAEIIYSCGNGGQGSNEQKVDSLVTTKQAQKQAQPSTTEQEQTELYKYFSKEEIKKGMDNAKNILTTLDKETGSVNILAYTDELFTKEGFAISPKELEKKWGKANSQEEEIVKHEVDEDIYKLKFANLEFNQFKIVLLDGGDYGWGITSFETSTPGFGIGGIYVGISECNKEYLLKLFEKFEVEQNNYDGNRFLSITLSSEFYSGLSIYLDENNLVKSISYTASTGM